jgi:hypothetical protein
LLDTASVEPNCCSLDAFVFFASFLSVDVLMLLLPYYESKLKPLATLWPL